MTHEVSVHNVVARPTAVIAVSTTWPQFPTIWKELLDEVWSCVHAGGIDAGCPNVMLYLDDVPNVEVGLQLPGPCPLTGRVVASGLPAGRVATTVHRGSYAGLDSAYRDVLEWCAANGQQVSRIRWEVYGPHHEDAAQLWVEISWLLADQ